MIADNEAANCVCCAVIYIWTLILPGHPLHLISYIGQTLRTGKDHEAAFTKRTSEHVTASARLDKDKEWGLHSLIRQLGKGVFLVRILETLTDVKARCKIWMNEREIALIKEHGGPMTSLESMPEGGQTLNLTHGGTGATCASIESWIAILDHRSQLLFEKFVKFLKIWQLANPDKNLSPPQNVVLPYPDDPTVMFPLGATVNIVRQSNLYNARGDLSRKKTLDDMGFVWNVYDAAEQEALDQFIDFVRSNGHGDVHRKYTSPSGYKLGDRVHDIRRNRDTFGILSTPSKKQLWETAGFDFDPMQTRFLNILERLHSKKKLPRESEFGLNVKTMRSDGIFLRMRPDRIKLLSKTGFKLNARCPEKNEEKWEEVLRTGTCSDWEKKAKKRKRSVG